MLFALVFAGARFDHQDAFAGASTGHSGHVHAVLPHDSDAPDHHRTVSGEQGLPGAYHCGSSILIVLPSDLADRDSVRSSYMMVLHLKVAAGDAALEPPPPRA